MNQIEITDKRKDSEFKSISFSKFKKSDAKKELLRCLLSSKIENAQYWTAELICAGHFLYLWEIIFLFMSKNIHIGNPKLAIYIIMRLTNFKDIMFNGYSEDMIKMRNNNKIRKLFAEIICVLCFSKKKNSYDVPKVKETDFDFFSLTNKLSAKNKKLGYNIFKNDDPNEIFVAVNEFAWNIHHKIKDNYKANYWLEWILEYNKLCKKKKIKKICYRRKYPVDDKFQKEMIWIIWDIIYEEAKKSKNRIRKNYGWFNRNFLCKISRKYKKQT